MLCYGLFLPNIETENIVNCHSCDCRMVQIAVISVGRLLGAQFLVTWLWQEGSCLQNQSWIPFGWGWGPTWMVAKWPVISQGLTLFKTMFAFTHIFRTVSVSPTTPWVCTALWEAERGSRDQPYRSMSWWRSHLGSHFVSWQAPTFLRATILETIWFPKFQTWLSTQNVCLSHMKDYSFYVSGSSFVSLSTHNAMDMPKLISCCHTGPFFMGYWFIKFICLSSLCQVTLHGWQQYKNTIWSNENIKNLQQ